VNTLFIRRCAAAGALILVPVLADAQGGAEQRRQQRPPPGAQQGDRIRQLMRTQLQLSDAQTARLQESNRRFAERRRSLMDEERQVRLGMRELLCSTDTTRGAEVARALDQLTDLQKRRMAIFDEEQRDLATFLNPYQRARFLGFQDVVQNQVRGRAGRMGQGEGAREGPPPGGRGGRARLQQGPPPGGAPPGGAPPMGPRGRGGPPPIPAGCGDVNVPPPGSYPPPVY
jgi:hypothetical protein